MGLLATMAVVLTGCASPSSSSTQTPAEKLAAIDGSGSAALFQRHLDSLAAKCTDSEEKIAALVYGTQKTMEGDGIHESLASLIAHLDQAFPSYAPKQHCAGVFAAYATLRTAK